MRNLSSSLSPAKLVRPIDPGGQHTHAWFAGFAPAEKPEIVIVVFVNRGRGSVEAAQLAHRIFEAYERHRP